MALQLLNIIEQLDYADPKYIAALAAVQANTGFTCLTDYFAGLLLQD
jgi:hypothetical protein